MTGARVDIQDEAIRAAIDAAIAAGADARAMLSDIGAHVLSTTQSRFQAKQAPDGKSWQAFSPKTLKRMPRNRRPPQLLRDTNRLYGSLTSVIEQDGLLVGTNVAYAGLHQFGGDISQAERQQTATFKTVNAGAGRKVVNGELVTYGSRLRFAKASDRAKRKQQKTFTVPTRTFTVPARPFLGISALDEIEIGAIIQRHLVDATGAAP